ncbi:MAG: hypothetical protein Fur0037_11310 [Planctomycetota bacterium]
MHQALRFLPAAALAAVLSAQTDYDFDKTTPGTLGASLGLWVRNAPANALLLSMPSFTAGPTPIALVDPGDPRSLSIGLDMTSAWSFRTADASGAAPISLALPANPALSGMILHWQTAALPGIARLVGPIGNDIVASVGAAGAAVPLAGRLTAARALAAVCRDADNNQGQGDVVIAGGGSGGLLGGVGLSSSEVWDFRHISVRPGPGLTSARALHAAVELSDGRTLLIGGVDAIGTVLASCEIYDPATNSFAPTGSLSVPRVLHAACRLANGRVLVAGGTTSLADLTAAVTNVQSSCEIFDPATGTWSAAAALSGRRLAVALSPLPNGLAMASGGVQIGFLFGIPISATSTTAVQFYNPATHAWSTGPSMHQGRAGHHDNQVALANGRILMTGGIVVPSLLNAANAYPTNGAEYYDPATNSWTVVNMAAARSLHTASRLPDGTVVVCGGAQGTLTAPVPIASVERFLPATSTWIQLAPLSTPRASHSAIVQPDGLLVLFGGQGPLATLDSIEVLHF